jgi:hypothetical protein
LDTPDTDRLALLERMADQQLRLNDQLIAITARLNQEQGLHAEALARADAMVTRLDQEQARHAERLERLDTILQAIRDLLDRPNGRP